VDDIRAYVEEAKEVGAPWAEAFDEAVLQKILPRISGIDSPVGVALEQAAALLSDFPLSRVKAGEMLEGFRHGAASYF
jgi:hypothetical protein